MTAPIIGIIASSMVIASLELLFHFEQKRGERFGRPLREALDRVVYGWSLALGKILRHVGSGFFKVSLHKFFHKLLMGILYFLKRVEGKVERTIRSNYQEAKKTNKQRKGKSMLDHVTEHKELVALSESEKRRHKESVLSGK